MKFYIFNFLFFISIIVFAQNNDSLKNTDYKLKQFITSVEFGPQYCYRFMHAPNNLKTVNYSWDGADQQSPQPVETYNPKYDIGGIGAMFGVYGNGKIYKGLRFKFGLTIEKFKYQTETIQTYYIYHPKYYGHADYTEKLVNNTQMFYDYTFATMPISFTYYLKISNRIFINAGLGAEIASTLFSEEKRVSEVRSRNETKSVTFPLSMDGLIPYTSSINWFGSFAVNYFISRKAFVSFEPYFKTAFFKTQRNGLTTDESIKLFSIGAKVGINF